MRRLVICTATTLLLLAGCTSGSDADGSDGSDVSLTDPDETPSPAAPEAAPSSPECAFVWVAGQVLPNDYTGCQSDGREGSQDVVECTDGASLIVYLDRFYGITGDEIIEPADAPLQDTEEYGETYSACTGE